VPDVEIIAGINRSRKMSTDITAFRVVSEEYVVFLLMDI
jgi:hypothetical protein